MNKSVYGYINLMLCVLLWAFVPVVTKKTLVELDHLQFLLYSTIFSLLIIGVFFIKQKKYKLIKVYKPKSLLNMLFLGMLGNYFYYVFLYAAIDHTTASEGFILAYTWPMLVLILSFVILKEKVTAKKILGVITSFVGIIIITTKGDITGFTFTSVYGDALALIGAFTFALFSVLGKKNTYDRIFSVFMYYVAALIFIVPTVFFASSFVLPSKDIIIWVLINGFFVNGISYLFWFNALDRVKTQMISSLLYLTPFVSLIYIKIFLDEPILISAIIGLCIIVIGVVSQYISLKKRKNKPMNIHENIHGTLNRDTSI